MTTIPMSEIVKINPDVISVGGSAVDMNGLFLTDSVLIPRGVVKSYSSASAVGVLFGYESTEYLWAQIYFDGFDKITNGSTLKPSTLLMTQYQVDASAAYINGAELTTTLAEFQAITAGALTITSDGTEFAATSIDLSSVTSLSGVATAVLAAFTDPTFTITYSSALGAFVVTNTTTGDTSTLIVTTSDLATAMGLTSAAGAVYSVGQDAMVPATFMDSVVVLNSDWALFTTTFALEDAGTNTIKLEFASWVNDQNHRYGYVAWDQDTGPASADDDETSLGYLLYQMTGDDYNYEDTCPVYDPDAVGIAPFIMGVAASIDFDLEDGRTNFTFRSQEDLTATVSDATTANHLLANNYNFYGAYGSAKNSFINLYPGTICGRFKYLDSFINQIWMNANFQLYLYKLLYYTGSIPYNKSGYNKIRTQLLTPITDAKTFGAIQTGVTLSSSQEADINSEVGSDISSTLYNQGWYLSVADPGATVRAARGTPACSFYYTDGQSVQKITMDSIEIE